MEYSFEVRKGTKEYPGNNLKDKETK